MRPRLTMVLFMTLWLIPLAAEAQRRPLGPMVTPRRGIPLYYDAAVLFTPDTSKVTINVHFRVPREFFIFVRNEQANGDSAFVATGEIQVELLNNDGATLVRDLRFLRLFRREPLTEGLSGGEIIGLSHFSVPPGSYRLAFSIDDKQSGRNFADRSRLLLAKGLMPGTMNVSKPMLLRPDAPTDSAGTQGFAALNYGGDILFGIPAGKAFLQVFSPDSTPDFQVRWSLMNKAPLYGIDSTELMGNDFRVVPGRLVWNGSLDTTLYTLDQSETGWYAIFLPLPLEKLFEGRCDVHLEVTSGSGTRNVTEEFRIVWPTKPGSLVDIDLAIDALQHIATEEQMDAIRSMSLSSRLSAFFAFWRAMDPDTSTAYNEMYAEYYRRVDIAMERFRGLREAEGYRTDQGRIFILYGAPTSSRRVFTPDNAPQEIWTYENVKQRFVFTDKMGTGVFILTSIDKL